MLVVPTDDPVKLIRLRMHNHGDRPRRLSATFYVELALGQDRDTAAMHVVTEIDAESGALFAHKRVSDRFLRSHCRGGHQSQGGSRHRRPV